MTRFDIEKITASKAELRRELAARPVAEKLRMLDELLRRARTIRRAKPIGCADSAKNRRD